MLDNPFFWLVVSALAGVVAYFWSVDYAASRDSREIANRLSLICLGAVFAFSLSSFVPLHADNSTKAPATGTAQQTTKTPTTPVASSKTTNPDPYATVSPENRRTHDEYVITVKSFTQLHAAKVGPIKYDVSSNTYTVRYTTGEGCSGIANVAPRTEINYGTTDGTTDPAMKNITYEMNIIDHTVAEDCSKN